LAVDLAASYRPPLSDGNILGTDRVGRDVLTLLMSAGRISLFMATAAVFVQLLLGISLGLISGYFKGWADRAIMALVDIILSIPILLVLLLAAALIGEMPVNAVERLLLTSVTIGLLSWPACARIVRSETIRLRQQGFVTAAKSNGISSYRILRYYILPNLFMHIAATAALGFADALAAESVLSFLGLGAQPPLISWGAMIHTMQGINDFRTRPWLWMGAGLLIILCVMSLHLIGEGVGQLNESEHNKS
jgi:peptide/nickel transport system permease protein